MSALSTPGGGGTTAQSKPTSGKQKYQKLDINSLYCANKNENSEPSSVKAQLSRKHGMQSLGKVPSARRPPANLPSLKTETGQDSNANSVSTVTTTVSIPATCTSQVTTTTSNSTANVGGAGGWGALPPPSSSHFPNEFPSLAAAAQPSHRSAEHGPQPQLRPQTEGSWTCGGTAGVRQETTSSPVVAPASTPASQQTPAYRAILPSFLMKGSSSSGLVPGTLSTFRDNRSNNNSGGNGSSNAGGQRQALRPPATPRAVEVLTARPILREEQISSLDDISRDAGWAQHDDIDYDQKLDFSDGESSAPTSKSNSKNNNNRASVDNDRMESKIQEPGDEDLLWAERRQKQSNEVAQAVARARQRKEEEQRRQMRDAQAPQSGKDTRDRDRMERNERDRNDNREKESDSREKDRFDNKDRDRMENRDKDRDGRDRDASFKESRNDLRDREARDKDRVENRDRDRVENRERFENRDRDRERDRERDRQNDSRDRGRGENRERQDNDKDRCDVRDRDRNDNRDRMDRDRYDRERERGDRDRDRDRERMDRERLDRDRDFRDRDYNRDRDRDRDQSNPAFSKNFQANMPPRFLRQQQNRQQEEQHKGWAFSGKPAPRRQEPQSYNNPPRHGQHNGRRSYSRDYSDREDDLRRDKEGSGPQWRSEMQDYERSGRELDRSNSRDSYKDYGDHKDRRNDGERKSMESSIDNSSRSAADKLTEVFERKSIGLTEPFASSESAVPVQVERGITSPTNVSQIDSPEKDLGKASWAEVTQEEQNKTLSKSQEIVTTSKETEKSIKLSPEPESVETKPAPQAVLIQPQSQNTSSNNIANSYNQALQNQALKYQNLQAPVSQNFHSNSEKSLPLSQESSFSNIQSQNAMNVNQVQQFDIHNKPVNIPVLKPLIQNDTAMIMPQAQKQSLGPISQQNISNKPVPVLKTEKEVSESESIASKSSSDPSAGIKTIDARQIDTTSANVDVQKRNVDAKGNERLSNEQINKIPDKEPIERKSSGSGSEKKGRGYGGSGGGGGGYNVYSRGWGTRESRGRRSHRSSRSNNRASESDGSTDGAANTQRKERRRAPRSPRGPKKLDRPEDLINPPVDQVPLAVENMENREPFAPRGQPSRRGRGGFQGTSRPPAPAKRVTGYGPPNTKSPFSQANRAVKDSDENKDNSQEDKAKAGNKSRTGSSTGRGRDRRPKGAGGPQSGEDENWETTSEHSESGGAGVRRRSIGGRQSSQSQKSQGGRNHNSGNRQNNNRNLQGGKKDAVGDIKSTDHVSEAMTDVKIPAAKKDDEVIDDGFQEVRNKKNSKDARASSKEDNQNISKQPRSRSNQGNGRNGSTSRNASDKSNTRGSAPVPGKPNSQYDRPRQANLAPRFVKQRQKQQMGLVFGPDTGAAPPPPAVNAWDKPISQSLRGNVDEPVEVVDNKSSQSSQRSTPGEAPVENKPTPAACALVTDKSGVLDGTTPPVETIIFENTNYKTAPPAEALKQKYQPSANTAKPQGEEVSAEMEARPLAFNGDVRARPRSIQDIMSENGRPVSEADGGLGLQMPFDTSQKTEDSSDMKLDFAFDSDLGQLTEDKSAKTLGLPRGTHMSTSNTISPLAADLNLKIASVKKVWEMPAVAEGSEELQFAGFEETNNETGAPPNVCKVKPTQQLQSPPPQHYNHVGYQGGYGGLSVPSPPAVFNFNSSQQLLGSSQQLPQQGGLYGAFLDQSRGQFGGFPGTPYGAGSAAPYNYQPPPDMFQSLPSQYRMAAAAGGGAAFGQSGQLGNNPSTVLISSTSNSLMSATVKPSSQQIGAIGSKGGGVGGVGGVNTFQQQYMGYSGPVGDAPYSLPGLLPRPAPPASSYYSPYQPPAAPAPTYPLQFTQPAQSSAFSSQFLSSQLHVAAAVQQMQQQYRAPPMQQQYAPPQARPPPQQQLKSPLHEHANGFAPLCDASSPTPKGASKPQKPHSPPHKYHAPPPHAPHGPHAPHPSHPQHPPPAHTPHQHHQHQQQQMLPGGNNGRCGGGASGVNGGNALARGGMAPRYPAPIQRPHAPALPLYRAPAPAPRPPHARPNLYYHHHQRNGSGGAERAPESSEQVPEEGGEAAAAPDAPPAADVKAD